MAASVDSLKADGNTAFSAQRFTDAISLYTRALELDGGSGPSAHVLLSNRSASYLARASAGDAFAALNDATACIRLNPTFAKGHSRKGSALLAMGQPEEAYAAFQQGIRHDPSSAALRDGMAAAQAAIAALRSNAPAKPSAPAAVPAQRHEAQGQREQGATKKEEKEEEDPLAAFLNEVQDTAAEVQQQRAKKDAEHAPLTVLTEQERQAAAAAALAEKAGDGAGRPTAMSTFAAILAGQSTALTFDRIAQAAAEQAAEENAGQPAHLSTGREYELAEGSAEARAQSKAIAEQDLGEGDAQAERLTGKFSEWYNLNPFDVLCLPHSCSEEDIKGRYRRISALVHPDKCSHERASDAFQEVKRAYDALLDPNRRRLAAGLIHNTIKEVKKNRKKRGAASATGAPLAAPGTRGSAAASSAAAQPAVHLETEDEEIMREVRKAFADVEQRRRNYENRVKVQAEREAEAAADELQSQSEQAKADQEWAKGRDTRKVAWEQFAGDGKRRKLGEGGLHVSDALRFGTGQTSFGPQRLGADAPTGSGAGTGAGGAAGGTASSAAGPKLGPGMSAEDHKRKWR